MTSSPRQLGWWCVISPWWDRESLDAKLSVFSSYRGGLGFAPFDQEHWNPPLGMAQSGIFWKQSF